MPPRFQDGFSCLYGTLKPLLQLALGKSLMSFLRIIHRIGNGLGYLEVGIADGLGQPALGKDCCSDADDKGKNQSVFDDALTFLVPFMIMIRLHRFHTYHLSTYR